MTATFAGPPRRWPISARQISVKKAVAPETSSMRPNTMNASTSVATIAMMIPTTAFTSV